MCGRRCWAPHEFVMRVSAPSTLRVGSGTALSGHKYEPKSSVPIRLSTYSSPRSDGGPCTRNKYLLFMFYFLSGTGRFCVLWNYQDRQASVDTSKLEPTGPRSNAFLL